MTSKEDTRNSLEGIPGDGNLGSAERLDEPTPISVDQGMLGFFAAGGEAGAFPLKVVGPRDVELSPDDIITAPDGGWGWVIVFIAFMSNMFVDGIIFSFGIIQNEIIRLYEVNGRGNDPEVSGVAWVGSLILGFNFLSGPITSTAADRFGFRAVSMTGAFIAGISFVIAAATSHQDTGLPRLPFMYIFYGVIAGLATGMIYMPSVVCVGYYFDKKRALAVGIAISGTGCGAFVFSLVTNMLVSKFGWRVATMVQGVCLFACSMIGALYRPLETHYHGDDCFKDLTKMSKQMRTAMAELYRQDKTSKEGDQDETAKEGKTSSPLKTSQLSFSMRQYLNVDEILQAGSSGAGKTKSARNLISSVRGAEGRSVLSFNVENVDDRNQGRSVESRIGGIDITFDEEETPVTVVQVPSRSVINRATTRPEAYVGGSTETHSDGVKYVYTIPAKSRKRDEEAGGDMGSEVRKRLSPSLNTAAVVDQGERDGGEQREGAAPSLPVKPSLVKRILIRLRSIRIASMPTFWIIAINGFLVTLGYPVPYIYLGQLAKENGVDEMVSSYLLSFLGMANTIGRILCGYFSDSPKVNSLYVNNIAGIVAGSVTCLIPFFASYGLAVFLPYTIVFGGSMACFATLRSILIRDFIGLSVLASAFGLCLSFQGVAAIASSPMAVGMREATNSYMLAFITSGGLIIAASLLTCLLPIAHKRQKIWDAKREMEEETKRR